MTTIGKSIVYICPHCGTKKAICSFLSYSNFDSSLWSDCGGEHCISNVQICPRCKKYYLTSTTEYFFARTIYSMDYGNLPYPHLKKALSQLLAEGIDSKYEYEVRLMIVRAFNDLYYNSPSDDIPHEEINYIKENVRCLLPYCKDLLLKAELHREIGEFDEAISLLENLEVLNGFQQSIAQRIREKIIAKDAKVFLLRGSNNRTPIMTCRTGYPYSAFRDILSAFFHIRFYGMIDRLINNSDADDEF